jgi:hypothetical protein
LSCIDTADCVRFRKPGGAGHAPRLGDGDKGAERVEIELARHITDPDE